MSSLGGGENEPLPPGWGRSSSAPRVGRVGDWSNNGSGRNTSSSSSRGRFGTIPGRSGGTMPGGGDDDDDDEEEDENKEGETWFAGGERSGISVQNPNATPGGGLIRDILRQAAAGGVAPSPDLRTARGPFSGGGHTLGSDEVESTFVPDPNAVNQDEDEVAIRHLHLWSDGFSIEDGPLMRYDEPGNQELLKSIQQGTAPLSLLNIRYGQRVNLNVITKLDEAYVPPRRGNFSGSGQRLGAPTPSISSGAASSSDSMPGSFPIGSSGGAGLIASVERQSINTHFEVDQTQPTTSVQIRLADGTRMPCRMNLTHTVGDIRAFINASRPENLTRQYTIGTTFPNRILEDDTKTIQAAGLVNSVVVQRWI